MAKHYWLDVNPEAATFETPEDAIKDWMADHDTIPSAVFWTEGGRNGSVAILADDWQHGPYRLGQETTY